MIPKPYCITLPENPSRTESARSHFTSVGLENVTFINGVNAEAFGLRTVFPYAVDDTSGNFNMGPKPTGIFLSHWLVWNILMHQPDSHFLIFEDDCKLPPGWRERTEKALADCPADYDMLFLGSCCTAGRDLGVVRGEVHNVRWPMCFHAYIVAKKFLPRLVMSQRKVWGPIDITVYLKDPRGGSQVAFDETSEIYTVLPRIAEQFNTEISV